jgi:hypothetical protein
LRRQKSSVPSALVFEFLDDQRGDCVLLVLRQLADLRDRHLKQCHVRDLCRSRCECHLAELIASFTHADADGRNGTGASPVQDHQYTLEERA